jgi:LysM repeat protein
MRVDAGGDTSSYVQNPPAPQTYTAQAHDSVASVAQTYQVTPEELARTNGISITTELQPNQILILPQNAVQPSKDDPAPKPQTPAEKTDAAIAAYDAAFKAHGDLVRSLPPSAGLRQEMSDTITASNATVAQAKAAMDKAIADEISGQVANRNGAVPPEFRTPTDQLITEFGQNILQRHQGDSVAQSGISDSIQTYQVKAKADALIPDFYGDWSAADKLKQITLQGQPPEVVNAVLADPRVQSWINQAAQDIGQPYKGSKPEDASWNIDKATQAAGNLQSTLDGLPPELATAVTQASLPAIEKISQLQTNGMGSRVPFNTVQGVLSSLEDSPQAQSVIDQAAGYFAKNYGLVNELAGPNGSHSPLANAIASDGKGDTRFARSLAEQLQNSGSKQLSGLAPNVLNAAADGLHDYLANNDTSPLSVYNRAHQDAEENTKHLSQLLARAGTLSKDQEQSFIKAYMASPENAEVYKTEAEAAKKLADYMNANQDSLVFAAGRNTDSAKQLYQCMQDLTQSGQGVTALKFAGLVRNDPATNKAFGQFSDYQTDFLPKVVASAQGELLVDDKGDTKSAVNTLLEMSESVFKGVNGWDKLKENYAKLADVKADPHIFDPKELADAYKEMGPKGRGFAMASIMVSSYNGSNAETITSMINAYSMAGGETAELASGALKYLADAGKFGSYTGKADAVAGFTAKFIPGLSVIASTSSFAQDFSKVKNDPVYLGAVVGDIFSVIGSGIETTGVGELPGEFVNGLGMLIAAPFQLVGNIIDGNREANELKKETGEYLKSADNLDDATIKALVESDPDQIKGLESLNMRPEDIQALGKDHPELLRSTAKSFVEAAQACGIQGDKVQGFADALEKDDPNFLQTFSSQPADPAHPLTHNANFVDLVIQGYPNAKAYLQANNSDLLSPDSTARRQADRQFEMEWGTSDEDRQIGNLLKSNGNTAYQVEIINLIKQQGGLDRWVQDISQASNGWPQAAKVAIQAAENAGTLSPDKASDYMRQLS